MWDASPRHLRGTSVCGFQFKLCPELPGSYLGPHLEAKKSASAGLRSLSTLPIRLTMSTSLQMSSRVGVRVITRSSTSYRSSQFRRLLSTSRPSQAQEPSKPPQQSPTPSPQHPSRFQRYARKQADSVLRTTRDAAIYYTSFLCVWGLTELAIGAPDPFNVMSAIGALIWAKVVRGLYDNSKDVRHSFFPLRDEDWD